MTIQHADRVEAELVTEDPRFQEATYFVNGQNGAASLLWSEWERGVWKEIKTWEQDSHGASVHVGSVGGEDLRYTFFFARLNGRLVGFYSSERLLADMKLIEAWLDKTPAGKEGNTCNAINFGSCARSVKAEAGKEAATPEAPGPDLHMVVDGKASSYSGTNTVKRACAVAEGYLNSDYRRVVIEKA